MQSSPHYTPQEEAYIDLYAGKTILLRVSGSVLNTPEFQRDAETMMELMRYGIKFILNVGGGPIIDKHYEDKKLSIKKTGGIRYTEKKAIDQALIPAAKEIRAYLADLFASVPIHFQDPATIKCGYLDAGAHGFVGEPVYIDQFDPSHMLSVYQFIGQAENGFVNVNADHMMKAILSAHGRINELVMLSDSNGIWDKDKNIFPVLTLEELAPLIDDGTIQGGMVNKANLMMEVIPKASKGVALGGGYLREELLGWKGYGTMVIDLFKHEHPMVKPEEIPIIEAVFADLMQAKGPFRQRGPKEIEEAITYHHLMKVKNSMLGGVSLIPRAHQWTELGMYWAGPKSNGYGRMILENAKAHANALSQKIGLVTKVDGAASSFDKAGFKLEGPLQEMVGHADMPGFIKDYGGIPQGKVVYTYQGH